MKSTMLATSCMILALISSSFVTGTTIIIKNDRSKEKDKTMEIKYKNPDTKETLKTVIAPKEELNLDFKNSLKSISVGSPRGSGKYLPYHDENLTKYDQAKKDLIITIRDRDENEKRKTFDRIYIVEIKEFPKGAIPTAFKQAESKK